MDYQRRERRITYHSPSCKMYLRHDFEHRCAYCGVVEDILSPIPSARELLFEKDHFVPQASGASDIHKYSNLYYACKKCNGLKDNLPLPLDPCVDDIWFGENPQFEIGSADKNFFVEPRTSAAKQYSKILQLNSRYHLEVREELHQQKKRKEEQDLLLTQLESISGLEPSVLSQIRNAMAPVSSVNYVDTLCGSSSWGKKFSAAYNQLVALGYECQVLLSDPPCDIAITIDEVTYNAEIRISQDISACRIPCDLLATWQKKQQHIGFIRYIPTCQQLLFYKIDFSAIDWSKKTHLLTSYIIL